MKYLIISLVSILYGCNIVALEANDPQDIYQESNIKGNWYYTNGSYVRIEVVANDTHNKTLHSESGLLLCKGDITAYSYTLKNDTLNVFYYNYNLSFVRK